MDHVTISRLKPQVRICYFCLLIIAMFTFTTPSLANDSELDSPEMGSEMQAIRTAIEKLFPLAVQSKKLRPSEEKQMRQSLGKLQEHVTKIGKAAKSKDDAIAISYEMLEKHLHQTVQAMENNEFDYAKSLAREIPDLCSGCHTQDEQQRNFNSANMEKKLKTDFLRAEYNFSIRNYNVAHLDYHDHLIKQRKIRHQNNNEEALERILIIYLQIFKDFANAKLYFQRLLNTNKLSPVFENRVKSWIAGLDELNTEFSLDGTENIKEIHKQIDITLKSAVTPDGTFFIKNEDKVMAIWLRGVLYSFMTEQPKHPDTAKILYWLASIENALDYGVSYQLPELYLKRCIVEYSKHPYAKKCFTQYEMYTRFLYTGSGGTRLPIYQREELKRLKALVE